MNDAILELKNLNVIFNLDLYRGEMIRDVFVRYISKPHNFLKSSNKKFHVLNNINLQVSDGDRVGVLGLNGSGKTTLCRTISGMYIPNSGTLKRQGSIRAIYDTNVGIQPELTGKENAYLLCRLLFTQIDDVDATVNEALKFSELGDFVDTPYRNYSKGMQARLCLSLISTQPAKLILLDEVFDGADTHFSKKVAARFLKMIEASGAVIFVSHDPGQIRNVCNKVIVMHRGKIEFSGDVEDGISFYNEIIAKAHQDMSVV